MKECLTNSILHATGGPSQGNKKMGKKKQRKINKSYTNWKVNSKPLFANMIVYRKAKVIFRNTTRTFKEISKILEQHTKIRYISIH